MIDNWLYKTKLKKAITIFVKKFLFGKVSANSLTILGLILGLLSALFIFLSGILRWTLELVIISAILMSISYFTDVLDGTLARLEEPTTFGGILDMFCDRTVEVFIIIAIVSTDPFRLLWPGLFTLGAIILCITIFLVVGGAVKSEDLEETQKLLYYSHGIMERSETFIFLLLITLFSTFFLVWRLILFWIFSILIFITVLQRLRQAYIMFKIDENEEK